ncbi:MAG: ATP-binding protein [Bdellovibrionota bacterium]|nr:ATP-binding protein [Bdellovibrionota bacterium]
MKSTLSALLYSGTEQSTSHQDMKRLVLFNGLCLFSGMICLALNILFIMQGLLDSAILFLAMMPLSLLSYFLNTKGFKTFAPNLFINSLILLTFAFNISLERKYDLHLLILAFLPLPNLLLPNEAKRSYFGMTLLIGFSAFATYLFNLDSHFFSHSNRIFYKAIVMVTSALIFSIGMYLAKKFYNEDIDILIKEHYEKKNNERISDIGRMTAGIAHEVNNPLAVIKTSASYFHKRVGDPSLTLERQRKELLRITNQVDRIVKIINGLGVVSKSFNKSTASTKNISETVTKVYELCSYKFNRLGIEHDLEVPYPTTYCNIHEGEIEQALLSLISNSLDALENCSEKLIKLSLNRDNENVLISVYDNGEGISDEVKDQILKPFFTTKPLGKGTGLGLSVTSEIISRCNGSLEYNSNAEGTCFTIRLPLADESRKLKAA